jgi:hypothetical protein
MDKMMDEKIIIYLHINFDLSEININYTLSFRVLKKLTIFK